MLSRGDAWRRLVAKVGTSDQDRTISLKAAVRSCTNKQTNHYANKDKGVNVFKQRVIKGTEDVKVRHVASAYGGQL